MVIARRSRSNLTKDHVILAIKGIASSVAFGSFLAMTACMIFSRYKIVSGTHYSDEPNKNSKDDVSYGRVY
ncbi:MAG: hypothetical protein ACUVWJ_00850 [Spirochaetota bacterium]